MESIRAEKAELIGKIPPHHAAHIVRLETLRQLLLHVAPDSAGSVRRIRSRSSAHGVRAGILVNERAALAWTEAVTRVADTPVPDDVYEAARAEFSERVGRSHYGGGGDQRLEPADGRVPEFRLPYRATPEPAQCRGSDAICRKAAASRIVMRPHSIVTVPSRRRCASTRHTVSIVSPR